MTAKDFLMIITIGIPLLFLIVISISLIIDNILLKTRKKKIQNYLIKHPELKVLLAERYRLTDEHGDCCIEVRKLQKLIDELEEKNRYLPRDKKIDNHIENFKNNLYELMQIEEEMRQQRNQITKDIENWWDNNYPNEKHPILYLEEEE